MNRFLINNHTNSQKYTKLKYERTWCDYLTKCPFRSGFEVGSYECQELCEHFISERNRVVICSHN